MSNNLASGVAKKINHHMPTILTALSGVGLAGTAYFAHQAGVKTGKKMAERDFESVDENLYARKTFNPYFWEDRIRENWQGYLIPVSVGVATLVCMVSANVLNTQRQATLMGAYALGERTWAKYRHKVAEMIGVENEQTIRDETVKDIAAETAPSAHIHGNGDTVYMDVFSGQMFRSDESTVRRAQELANERAEEDGFVRLNYFYDLIGARTTQLGELVGWSDGFQLDVILTPVTFEDGTEGFGLDYARQPFWGYHGV